jgi:hypothetical protein
MSSQQMAALRKGMVKVQTVSNLPLTDHAVFLANEPVRLLPKTYESRKKQQTSTSVSK